MDPLSDFAEFVGDTTGLYNAIGENRTRRRNSSHQKATETINLTEMNQLSSIAKSFEQLNRSIETLTNVLIETSDNPEKIREAIKPKPHDLLH